MSELIPTGYTFGQGRQAINNAFSGEATFNTISATTIFSGSTNMSDYFGLITTLNETTASYDVKRYTIGGFKFFSEITLKNVTETTILSNIPIIPTNYEGKNRFKLNTMLVSYKNVSMPEYDFGNGFLEFNHLLQNSGSMTIELLGNYPGNFNYIDDTIELLNFENDTTTQMEYNTLFLPNFSTNEILMNFSGRTGFSGTGDIVIIIEGMLV